MGTRVYSRHQLRLLFASWLRRNTRAVAVVALIFTSVVVAETWFLLSLESAGAFRWYLMGAAHTFAVGIVAWALFLTFLTGDPHAVHQLRGAWGEENTQDLLKRARRKRLIWGWVDSISLNYGDIDHLVVTRHGGLVAIDSKWRNAFNPQDRDAMARSAEKARLRANGVVDTVLRGRGRAQRATGPAVRIRPLVVIWGGLQSEIPDSARVDGVDFVAGNKLVAWLEGLTSDSIDKQAASELLRRIEAFRSTSDAKIS